MEMSKSERLYLTEGEFCMLAASAGLRKWYGFSLDREKVDMEREEDLNRILASLYQKEVLDWEDGKAKIRDEYAGWFSALSQCRLCIIYKKAASFYKTTSAYISGSNVVVVERSANDDDKIVLYMTGRDAWTEDLIQDGFCFESVSSESMSFEGVGFEGVGFESTSLEDLGAAFEDPDLKSSFEIRRFCDGALMGRLLVYDHGSYGVIASKYSGKSTTMLCNYDNFRKAVSKWIVHEDEPGTSEEDRDPELPFT